MITPTIQNRLDARTPPERSVQVMHQIWENLLFLHWKIPANAIQKTLPPGLYIDTFEDHAWLGVVPFFMSGIRPSFLPALPWLSWFLELNVRTYVHDRHGVPGVWFYSLDASQPVAVALARNLFHLPYFHARMKASCGDWIDYRSTRKGIEKTAHYRYRGTGNATESKPGSLEFSCSNVIISTPHEIKTCIGARSPIPPTSMKTPRWRIFPLCLPSWMDSGI